MFVWDRWFNKALNSSSFIQSFRFSFFNNFVNSQWTFSFFFALKASECMKCFNLWLNFSIDVFKIRSSFANKSLTWFEEESRRFEKYIISLCSSWMSLTRSSSWSIVAYRIFVKTWWKCFIHINCRLIVLANLALYSNKYSRFKDEIRLFRMTFFMYLLCSFRCKFIEINLFFNLKMLINEFVNIIFFKFEKITLMLINQNMYNVFVW